MEYEEIIIQLRSLAQPQAVAGVSRFGIDTQNALGISLPALRKMARQIGKNHNLALQLWDSGIHEARLLAGMIAEPQAVTESQMEKWVSEFDSWDICDPCCSNLFDKTPFAYRKAEEWSRREEEFIKRAGFVLMATLAVHDKQATDTEFAQFLTIIAKNAGDERNFVRKAVNWALRQIGKRNLNLNRQAIATTQAVQKMESPTAHWIAADAWRELTSSAVQNDCNVKTASKALIWRNRNRNHFSDNRNRRTC